MYVWKVIQISESRYCEGAGSARRMLEVCKEVLLWAWDKCNAYRSYF